MQPEEMRAIRKAANLTQEELAELIGMSRVTIGLMERGEAPIEKRTELAILFVTGHRYGVPNGPPTTPPAGPA